jgi:hypothetical protein
MVALVSTVAAAIAAAGLAPGCDRTVDLTPFYDAQPDPDGQLRDGFDLDTAIGDSHPAVDGGIVLDGGALDDGNLVPDDGPPGDGK